MQMPIQLSLILTACSIGLVACSDTSFNGRSGKTTPPPASQVEPKPGTNEGEATVRSLNVTCPPGGGEAHLVTDVTGAKATTVHLEGDFCGVTSPQTASGALSVLFIVDWSGSMGTNDPLAGDSCGRLTAAQAVVSKLKAAGSATVNVGVVPFGSRALTPIPLAPVDTFSGSSLTSQVFCRADGGTTNYDAALRAAKSQLSGVQGAKYIYFITDGQPTAAGDGNAATGGLGGILGGILGTGGNQSAATASPTQAGLSAAQDLRSLSDLTLYTLYLTDRTGGIGTNGSNVDPAAYLQQIAGDPNNQRTAANAADLVKQIQTLGTPTAAATLDPATATGTLDAATFGQKTVKLASVDQDQASPGVWHFTTEPFALQGGSQPTANNVALSIKGKDGKVYKASATINFTIDPNAKN